MPLTNETPNKTLQAALSAETAKLTAILDVSLDPPSCKSVLELSGEELSKAEAMLAAVAARCEQLLPFNSTEKLIINLHAKLALVPGCSDYSYDTKRQYLAHLQKILPELNKLVQILQAVDSLGAYQKTNYYARELQKLNQFAEKLTETVKIQQPSPRTATLLLSSPGRSVHSSQSSPHYATPTHLSLMRTARKDLDAVKIALKF
jgi:hypothetical protein